MHFGAHGPHRPGRTRAHLAQDVFGGPGVVRRLHHFERHLGMHDHVHARMLDPHLRDLLRAEAHMHRAVALPQDETRGFDLLTGESAERLMRIPHHHLIERHIHLEERGVAAQVLIGQEQDLLLLLPAPRQHGRGVGRRAHRAALLAHERLNRGRRVDVGDRHRARRHTELFELAPADLQFVGRGHVGHGAARREVWQNHLLMRQGEHIGALGHEMHAAEHDVLGLRVVGHLA